jgi:hypothetical protein
MNMNMNMNGGPRNLGSTRSERQEQGYTTNLIKYQYPGRVFAINAGDYGESTGAMKHLTYLPAKGDGDEYGGQLIGVLLAASD